GGILLEESHSEDALWDCRVINYLHTRFTCRTSRCKQAPLSCFNMQFDDLTLDLSQQPLRCDWSNCPDVPAGSTALTYQSVIK
ncbi:hypothetical protein KUCAC02_025271, partial [Chaenocephalus aceratus]